MHRRWLAGVAGVLALAAACGDDGDTAAPTTTTEATTTTTEADATTTTTIEDESPPELHNTGDDYVAIYESLSEYIGWMDRHPSLEGLDVVWVPGSPAFEAVERITRVLVENGWRWDGPTAEEVAEVGDRIDARSVTVIVTSHDLSATLIDASGAPVPEQPEPAGDGRVLVQLALGDDGRWRIASNQLLERTPG